VRFAPKTNKLTPPIIDRSAIGTIVYVHFIICRVSNQLGPENIRFGIDKRKTTKK
jgi:hypothetical protein